MTLALVLAAAFPAASASQEIRSEDPLAAIESSYQKAVARAGGSVVALRVERDPEPAPKAAPKPAPRLPGLPPGDDVFGRRPKNAWCSGVVVEPDGLILTTHFNVSGRVRSIRVLLADGRELDGRLLGYNGTVDLAAVKVDAENLPVLAKAPVERLKAGSPLIALGRAPDGKGLTVNPGIVSAASRLGGKGIQTDAKLNFGNVGGPVVDLDGRLVGISCKVDVKYASSRGQNSGVGFAITHDRLGGILAELKAGRNEAESRRPFLGIEFNAESKVEEGVELRAVTAGGAAERAGLRAGDVITAFDGVKVAHFDDLRGAILRKAPGDKVKVRFIRGEESFEADCELGWAPGE
jgi:S1-C subfamily serine protease